MLNACIVSWQTTNELVEMFIKTTYGGLVINKKHNIVKSGSRRNLGLLHNLILGRLVEPFLTSLIC